MSDDIGGVWRTIGGRRVFIKDGEDLSTAMKRSGKFKKSDISSNSDIKEKHEQAIKELSKDKYADGTYDADSLKEVSYNNGYQVTFSQIGDNYDAKEYQEKVDEFLKFSSDKKVCAGKFESTPEISFHFKDKNEAIKLAKKYNQISVWDWEECREIKTGGTGRRG